MLFNWYSRRRASLAGSYHFVAGGGGSSFATGSWSSRYRSLRRQWSRRALSFLYRLIRTDAIAPCECASSERRLCSIRVSSLPAGNELIRRATNCCGDSPVTGADSSWSLTCWVLIVNCAWYRFRSAALYTLGIRSGAIWAVMNRVETWNIVNTCTSWISLGVSGAGSAISSLWPSSLLKYVLDNWYEYSFGVEGCMELLNSHPKDKVFLNGLIMQQCTKLVVSPNHLEATRRL